MRLFLGAIISPPKRIGEQSFYRFLPLYATRRRLTGALVLASNMFLTSLSWAVYKATLCINLD